MFSWIIWPLLISISAYALIKYFSSAEKYNELEPTSKVINVLADLLLPPLAADYHIKPNDFLLKSTLSLFNQLEPLFAPQVMAIKSQKVCIQQEVDKTCSISAIIYSPPSENKLRPVIVWYHGGGWILGSPEGDDNTCRKLSLQLDAVVVNVDYRLAPKYRFPIGVDDSFFAFRWVQDYIEEYGGDSSKIVVAGESAGGNLAAVVAVMDLTHTKTETCNSKSIKALLLVYPAVDWTSSSRPLLSNLTGILSHKTIEFMRSVYTSGKDYELRNDYRYAPLHASEAILSRFPPIVMVLAKHDVLAPEGLAFADKLSSLNVSVSTLMYNQSIHGFYGRWHFAEGDLALNQSAAAVQSSYLSSVRTCK